MTLNDLPEIQITRNVRSTRLKLRVEGDQIRLTAPVFCTKKQIQNFIDQAESWLLKTWKLQQEKNQSIDRSLPAELQLFNQAQPIQIVYQSQKQDFVFDAKLLQLSISDRHPETYLKAFVITYAKEQLPVYLNKVSQETGLSFNICNVRQPKTRWGSCSAKHDIMLNSGIILFPENIVRYLCVHELAHTRHFDHSPRFWAEVAKHHPNYLTHRKILKNTVMPWWWVSQN
ncbi:M48 family metallopeptidase [Acinetobacter schindleri]|uniref:M48 family metallopeptidase n=1 Tax=Acinetobacter schindleri TaxID=108981 RepID=A0AAE6WWF9_9GAMM|nr:SprT family zinc-dependent metalloprotease [Acinetobacter schindleri]QIC67341.1 M48 family metallopeptidase [Acinetobacter schindleri]